jgi:hypothetical protein
MVVRTVIFFTIAFHTALAWAGVGETLFDYLRETPAVVAGHIGFSGPKKLYQSGPVSVEVRPTASDLDAVGFTLSENELNIRSEKAIELKILGMPIRVTSIHYDQSTQKFSVETKTPGGVLSKELSAKISEVLDNKFKSKMQAAFQELTLLRKQNKASDVGLVAKSISGIFTDGKIPSVGDIHGEVSLIFNPPADRDLGLGKLNAKLVAGDSLEAAFTFHTESGHVSISDIEFTSQRGVRVTQAGEDNPEIKSLLMRSIHIGPDGMTANYVLGSEEVAEGMILALAAAQSLSSTSTGKPPCTKEIFQRFHNQVDHVMQTALAGQVESNRERLQALGVEARTLDALSKM